MMVWFPQPDIAEAEVQRDGSPRVGVVFRLWQCDKENQGWREGPPLTVRLPKFRSAGRAFTLRLNSDSNEKRIQLLRPAASPSLRTLAGLKRHVGD